MGLVAALCKKALRGQDGPTEICIIGFVSVRFYRRMSGIDQLGNLCFFRMGCNVSKSDIEGLIHFCKTGDFADGIAYESLPLNSEEAVKIMMEDLREAKLHQEVYLL